MKINNFDLTQDVFVIAEIGNNHEGSFAQAKKMIEAAAESGVHAVKFQTIIPDRLVSVQDEARLKQLSKFQLSHEDYRKLSKIAEENDVLFLSTPFDVESVAELEAIVPAYKIASGDNDFYPLLDAVAKTGKPLIVSGGLCTYQELEGIRDYIYAKWKDLGINQDLSILHCVVSYPTANDQANLAAIKELSKLGVTVGYSDHTLGIEAAVLAVALGARIIEKHFTLDKNYSDFHDHKISADPDEMRALLAHIKLTQELLGSGTKEPQRAEKEIVSKVRRSIVAKHALSEGQVLSYEDLSWVRPGSGIRPGSEELILGKKLNKALEKGEMIRLEDLV